MYRRRTYALPVIAPKAIQEYKGRVLDDWRWLKKVPRKVLETLIPEGFKFITEPRKHQLVCSALTCKLPRFLLLLDMGSGKTKIILDAIRFRKWKRQLRCALVVVPNVINLESWKDQLEQHAPDLKFAILGGSRLKRYTELDRVIEEKVDVCVINYAGLTSYMAPTTRQGKNKKGKKAMQLDYAADFASIFNLVAFDEPHLYLSGMKGITFNLCKFLSWNADFAYATTGTPFDKNPGKAFPQFLVVDKGETFGESLGMFHAAYYTPKKHPFKGWEFIFDKSARKDVHRVLQHRSIRYEDYELTTLPAVSFNRIMCPLTKPQLDRYNELLELANEARQRGEREATWIRLRQTVAGFISIPGDEDSPKVQIAFNPNGKALALEQYLLELPEDEKVVIFHEFVPSGIIIQDLLKRMKIRYAGVGHGFKDPRLQLRKFMTDPFTRVWCANWKAGGTGADGLQKVARYGVFYETPSSPSQRRQCWKRLDRDGQLRKVHITDLVAAGVGIDLRILKGIKIGMDMFEAVCSGKERL